MNLDAQPRRARLPQSKSLFDLFLLLAAVIAPLLGVAPARADDEPLIDYVVHKGDTCVSISRKLYGDATHTDLLHKNNVMGPAPHSLKEGTVLRVPPHLPGAKKAGADAHLTFLRNQVDAYTPDRHAGAKDEGLQRGHRVSTLDASSAEVTFVDESRLQLGEHTLVVILGSSSSETQGKGSASDTTLMTGTLRAHLAELAGGKKKPAPLSLQTPAGRVQMEPGEAQLAVDEKKTTRLAVYRGRSKLRASGKEVEVPQGFGSKADEGKAPTKPRPLPAPPVWSAPPPSFVLTGEEAAEVTGTYAPGPLPADAAKVATWHVQLARDEKFNDLLVDTRVPATVTTLDAKQVPPGTWFVRVSGIDDDQFEGKPGDPARVLVIAAKTSLGGVGQPATVNVTFGAFCSLDGAPFTQVTQPIVLAPGRAHDLQCAADSGGTGAKSLPLPNLVVAAPPPPAPAPVIVRPVAPLAPAPRIVTGQIAVLGGVHYAGGGVAAGGGIEGGLRIALGNKLGLGLALRATVDQYFFTHSQSVALFSLPVTLQFGAPTARFIPYLGAMPELVLQRGPDVSSPNKRFGFAALLGGQLHAGPGGLFLELGYERAVTDTPPGGTESTLNGFFGLLGYRITPL